MAVLETYTHIPILITPVEPDVQRKIVGFWVKNMVKIYGFKLRLENTLKKQQETQCGSLLWLHIPLKVGRENKSS